MSIRNRNTRIKLLVVLMGCACGIAISLGFATRGQSGALRISCGGVSIGANAEHVVNYDPVTGYLGIDYYAKDGRLTHVDASERNAACTANAGIGRVLAEARATAKEIHDGDCAAFEQALAGGALPVKEGIKPNLEAAKKAIQQEC
jgi:hypothetical protein